MLGKVFPAGMMQMTYTFLDTALNPAVCTFNVVLTGKVIINLNNVCQTLFMDAFHIEKVTYTAFLDTALNTSVWTFNVILTGKAIIK